MPQVVCSLQWIYSIFCLQFTLKVVAYSRNEVLNDSPWLWTVMCFWISVRMIARRKSIFRRIHITYWKPPFSRYIVVYKKNYQLSGGQNYHSCPAKVLWTVPDEGLSVNVCIWVYESYIVHHLNSTGLCVAPQTSFSVHSNKTVSLLYIFLLNHHKLLWSIIVLARHCWPLGLFFVGK